MAALAEFRIPAEEFALYETLERRPELTFEIDRVVAYNTTQIAPFLRATQGEFEGQTGYSKPMRALKKSNYSARVKRNGSTA